MDAKERNHDMAASREDVKRWLENALNAIDEGNVRNARKYIVWALIDLE